MALNNKTPAISVIIITWNRKDDVLKTIQDIYDQPFKDFEIIVVDNGSKDGTTAEISVRFPQVKLIGLDQNTGVSHARNEGFNIAIGKLLVCLDSDASPASHMFSNLIKRFQMDPKIGVINSKIVNAYTKQIDNIAGWSYSKNDLEFQDTEFLSFSFSEGGCAIKKEALNKVGPFWERLFFGYEGMEFSLRVLDAGYDILYYPGSLVYHRASPHARIHSGEREQILFSHCLSVYLARYPWWMFLIFAPLKTVSTFIRSVRHGYLIYIVRGLGDFLKQAISILKERKPIRNQTALHYLTLQRQHGPLNWNIITWLKYKA